MAGYTLETERDFRLWNPDQTLENVIYQKSQFCNLIFQGHQQKSSRLPFATVLPGNLQCVSKPSSSWGWRGHRALTALGILTALFFFTGLFGIMASRTRSSVQVHSQVLSYRDSLWLLRGNTQTLRGIKDNLTEDVTNSDNCKTLLSCWQS